MTARPNLRAHLDGLAERSPSASASAGVRRFSSAAVPLATASATANTLVRVREDVAGFAGGQVWRLDWCPRVVASGARHLAVECRAGNNVEHDFDRLGEGRGPALVQVWALRPRDPRASAARAPGPDAAPKRKRDQPQPAPSAPTSCSSSASMVLGLAHEGGYALDLRWCRSPDALGRASAGASLGLLAVALGDGRVEVWCVPEPEPEPEPEPATEPQPRSLGASEPRSSTSTARASSSASPAVVRPNVAHVGVLPPECGVALALDWCAGSSRDRLVAGTSGGHVVVWIVPRLDAAVSASRARAVHRTPDPAFPAIVMYAGCPQRAVACPPEEDEGAEAAEGAEGADDVQAAEDLSNLILSAGHCMKEPALWDARDPFSPVAGRRGEAFAGGFFQLSAAWLREGCVVTGSDNGEVALHDPFHPARFERLGKDGVRTKRRLIGDKSDDEGRSNAVVLAGAKQSAVAAAASVSAARGAVWAVDAKAITVGRDGCSLIAAATGSRGLRVAMTCAAGGIRAVDKRDADAARRGGVPVDLERVGGASIATARGEARAVTLFGQKHTPGDDDANLAAIRCARWWRPHAPAVIREGADGGAEGGAEGGDGDPWLAWGDDSGFVRFQRFDSGTLATAAAALSRIS